jgi:hypothetical protein
MLMKYFGPSMNGTPDPSADRWIPRLGALVVLGVLLVTLPAAHETANAMKAAQQPPMLHTAGCPQASPSVVDLMGALEGQPPVPHRGARTCG